MNLLLDHQAELFQVEDLQFRDSFVCFIDVLGFKKIAFNTERTKAYFQIVSESIAKVLPILNRHGAFKFGIMSDSIVLAVAYNQDYESKLQFIRGILGGISMLQYYLATRDFWVRGGISYGPIAFSDTNSFVGGEGLVNAYLLENLAKYPRIIVDPRLFNILDLTKEEFISEINYSKKFKSNTPWIFDKNDVFKNSSFAEDDTFLFINYMSVGMRGGILASEEIEKINENLKYRLSENSEYREKYCWVKNYFKALNIL